ncbi:hypothetical protein llap_21 [Limosa lapponica baueri]|uniref:Uncharacterized protein n=1 Tax=Limosa lapponica baueri TaxID=1758121 RepID=A0A2I0UUB0_LIMLA|nr:hypothetical protein llap_21 [Limosa lapponica baueri]
MAVAQTLKTVTGRGEMKNSCDWSKIIFLCKEKDLSQRHKHYMQIYLKGSQPILRVGHLGRGFLVNIMSADVYPGFTSTAPWGGKARHITSLSFGGLAELRAKLQRLLESTLGFYKPVYPKEA